MDSYRTNKFLFITSVLSILILCIGGTLSYFSVSNRSKYDAVQVKAEKIQLALSLNHIYTGYALIPTNDDEIMTAYENKCKDLYGNGACLAYGLEISNFNGDQDMLGKINFDVKGISNLSYIVLDEKGNLYKEKVSVGNGVTEGLSLGEHFVLGDANANNPSTKKFTLIIWLTNLENEDQTSIDAGGNFTASVSFESAIYGSKLTGTINGYGQEENSTTGGEAV